MLVSTLCVPILTCIKEEIDQQKMIIYSSGFTDVTLFVTVNMTGKYSTCEREA